MKVYEGVLRDAVKARLHSTGTAQSRGLSSLDCEVLALHAMDAVLGEGWRIVRTGSVRDMEGQRSDAVFITEEWKP